MDPVPGFKVAYADRQFLDGSKFRFGMGLPKLLSSQVRM
jgi:hypothetical protein